MTTTTVKQTKAVLASALGVDEREIKTAPSRWLELLKEGVVVKVHMGRWRARTSLGFDDLGLHLNGEAKLYDDLIVLGSKLLLDKETEKALVSIESQARQTPGKYGFETSFGVFIPATAYQPFMAEMEALKARWFERADYLAANYASVIEPHLDKFSEAARVAYRRANRLQAGIDLDYRYLPEDQYVDRFMTRIRSLIPTPDSIRRSFTFEVELTFVPLPSMIAADEAEADRVRVEAIMDREALEGERKRQAMIDAMNEDVLRQAREQKEKLVTGFVADVAGQLRSLVYEALSDVQRSLDRNGKLHSRSVVQVRNLVEQLERLNFIGDRDIEQAIARMRQIVDQPAEQRELADVSATIRELRAMTRRQLAALGQESRIARTDYGRLVTPQLDVQPASRVNGSNGTGKAEILVPVLDRANGRSAGRSL